ncbi:CBO0543 family protein [Niallia sp. Sow4_A1]|uniref:CBO0543 family protein n=1 Tax=Niallia hominis TaxID=3133173 RepID=A0ABV1EUM7_9BACI
MGGIYPAINVIFLNYFPYKSGLHKKIVYIFTWGVIAMVYETFFIYTGTFYLNGWKQFYSIFTYLVLYVFLMLFHKLTVRMIERSRRERSD